MAAEFDYASEVREIAREIIQQHHSHLVEAHIVYLFRDGGWESRGRTIYGKAYKLSGREKFLSDDADFAIVINKEAWLGLQPHQQKALVDHELCHCGKNGEDEDGNPIWCLWDHDVEEFRAVIDRHGLWAPDVRKFAETAAPHVKQQTLFDLMRSGRVEVWAGGSEEGPAEAAN